LKLERETISNEIMETESIIKDFCEKLELKKKEFENLNEKIVNFKNLPFLEQLKTINENQKGKMTSEISKFSEWRPISVKELNPKVKKINNPFIDTGFDWGKEKTVTKKKETQAVPKKLFKSQYFDH
jgi:phosphopantothenoylcysteine synthetase/decarboxylase